MGYSTKNDILFYGQFATGDFGASGYDEEASYAKAIKLADSDIDGYCNVPEGFFTPGGIEIQQEYLNGKDVAYIGGVTKFFNWYSGGTSHLKFKHKPVLSVTKLEEETGSGSWITRTEATDYIVVEDGVRYITNTPSYRYKNVRATYKAGYTTTPSQVVEVSACLAAAYLQRIQDAKNRTPVATQGQNVGVPPDASLTKPIFTDDLKAKLNSFRQLVYGFG